MSDTPRTDKFEIDYFNEDTSHVDDVFEYARKLERENVALREDNERMKERLELIQSVSYLEPLAWGKAVQAAIDAARKEVQP